MLEWFQPADWFESWRNNAEPIESLATTIAIGIGAIWALLAFVRRRERFPHLNVEHVLTHWRVGDSRLLHLRIRVTNVGAVVGRLRDGKAWIQQMLPTPDEVAAKIQSGEDPVCVGSSEIIWPLATDVRLCDWSEQPREVEPGEIDEYPFDFVIPGYIAGIQVYSHLRNHAKRGDIGWNTTTVHLLNGGLHGEDTEPKSSHDGTRSRENDAVRTKTQVEVANEQDVHEAGTAEGNPAATAAPTKAIGEFNVENESRHTSGTPEGSAAGSDSEAINVR